MLRADPVCVNQQVSLGAGLSFGFRARWPRPGLGMVLFSAFLRVFIPREEEESMSRRIVMVLFAALTAAALPVAAQQGLLGVSAMGGRCLDIKNGGSNPGPGTELITYKCQGSINQLFDVMSGFKTKSGACLIGQNAPDTPTIGDRIVVGSCARGTARWRYSMSDATIRSAKDQSKCMGAIWGSPYDAVNVIVVNCSGDPAQHFFAGVAWPPAKFPGVRAIEPGARGNVSWGSYVKGDGVIIKTGL